jgi:hypothetical protein
MEFGVSPPSGSQQPLAAPTMAKGTRRKEEASQVGGFVDRHEALSEICSFDFDRPWPKITRALDVPQDSSSKIGGTCT